MMAAVLAALQRNDVDSCLLSGDIQVNSDIDIAYKISNKHVSEPAQSSFSRNAANTAGITEPSKQSSSKTSVVCTGL